MEKIIKPQKKEREREGKKNIYLILFYFMYIYKIQSIHLTLVAVSMIYNMNRIFQTQFIIWEL